MKTLSFSTLKTVATGSIVAALLAVTTGCVTAPSGYNGYDDLYEHTHKDNKGHKKHKDKNDNETETSLVTLDKVTEEFQDDNPPIEMEEGVNNEDALWQEVLLS